MDIWRKSHGWGMVIAIIVASFIALPSVNAGELRGTEWKVTSGDTLYAIGRAVYPGDVRKQAKLRQDIMTLNPAVFAGGANNMKVGVVLKLPGYVVEKTVAPKSAPPVISRPAPVPAKVTPRAALSPAGVAESGAIVWKVKQGDTLYAICRTIFPGDARQQAQLGRDIKKLNPSVFASGAYDMKVGDVLRLPSYVPPGSVPSVSVPTKIAEPEAVPPTMLRTEEIEPEPAPPPAPITERRVTRPTVKKQPVSSTASRVDSGAIVSLGYSSGGDKLVDVTNGADIFAGTGFHLRLGYEQMFQRVGGYRVSLGLQHYRLLSGGASYQDTYMQLAYQYRMNPVMFGIGVITDLGATLDSHGTYKFKPATGATVYMEYLGTGLSHGWGISATSLNIKEKETGTSFSATRGEIYYRWKF